MGISCDLFCRVVDNLGDAGVCWRLARQLAVEFGWQVRLWIDDPAPLAALAPDRAGVAVAVHRWQGEFPDVEAAQVVIEAFACELPPRHVERMAAQPRPPVWINLEYLSAEDWVPGCHGQPSPHPTLPLPKHFFFPGFVAGTGGLIRERDADFGQRGIGSALAISMFCYDNPALPALLDVWAGGEFRARRGFLRARPVGTTSVRLAGVFPGRWCPLAEDRRVSRRVFKRTIAGAACRHG